MRFLDLLLSLTGLVVLSPLFIVLALLVRITSEGPIFYRATRVGKYGRTFHLYKFRSMVSEADKAGPGLTLKGDSRVTPIGEVLRRYRLDELPQLFNVLKGDMSLVGPRPEDPRYVGYYSAEQRRLLQVKPGITSAASLQFRDEATMLVGKNWEDVYIRTILPAKLGIELTYLQERTLWSDLLIILRTVLTVARHQ